MFWELDLLKLLGYDLELKNLVEKDVIENKTFYYFFKKYVRLN